MNQSFSALASGGFRENMKKGELAVSASGIVPAHIPALTEVARRESVVIMIRPVNHFSTQLIAEGFATKGLHVKGKSSDWGPQAGFICCDQSLSKLGLKSPDKVPAFNEQVRKSLKEKDAEEVPLLITKERMKLLVHEGVIKIVKEEESGAVNVLSSKLPHKYFRLIPHQKMPTGAFPLLYKQFKPKVERMTTFLPRLKFGYWVMVKKTSDYEAVSVLAEPDSMVPLTADYDLFAVCPSLSSVPRVNLAASKGAQGRRRSLSPPGGLPDFPDSGARRSSMPSLSGMGSRSDTPSPTLWSGRPEVAALKNELDLLKAESSFPRRLSWNAASSSVRNALGVYDRRRSDPDMGKIEARTIRVKDAINHAIGVQGGRKVVHHGVELDNPVTELDYPITVITPGGEVVSAENQMEIQAVARDVSRLGFVFRANRLWTQVGAISTAQPGARDYQWNDRVSESELSVDFLEVLSRF